MDVETASRAPGSICQIGLGCVRPDNFVETFSTHVDPQVSFDPFNVELHGIGPDTVVDAPCFAEAWGALLPLLTRHHLVQHSRFDQMAIEAACRVHDLSRPELSWTDSVKIARRAWPEFKGNGGHGLGHLKDALGLEFRHHDAGEDARAAAQVMVLAEERLGKSFAQIAVSPYKAQIKLSL
nr:exonuclease domain-containing protein [Aliiroseovarius subalbicans]